MNAAVAQTRRLAVSPYARRLARERNLPLETLRGTGPAGRILAADVNGFVPVPVPETRPVSMPAAAPAIAAFTTSIALGAMRELLGSLENSGRQFGFDDILLRAVGCAFDDTPDVTTIAEAPVALELDGRQVTFSGIRKGTPTSLRAARLEALADARDETAKPAALSVRLLPVSQIRPLMMPLLSSRAMRLTVSADATGEHAECLLIFDAAIVEGRLAAAWLACVKSAIENPLRLFV
jgi:pyruvate/2-oxoglutarate dehydrogenase complex dihydrolipoamide acyltransferase (E2) component